MGKTHIEISEGTRDKLRVMKAKDGLTYNELIESLIKDYNGDSK